MTRDGEVIADIETFLAEWPGADQPLRDVFRLYYQELSAMAGVTLSFTARPGVSYSLRPRRSHRDGREFFAVIDVIDDEPQARWLSVCFYQDMITDPEGRGQCIPGGLAGDDGYCFDISEATADLTDYLVARLREAGAG
jgi:hypothetical protein